MVANIAFSQLFLPLVLSTFLVSTKRTLKRICCLPAHVVVAGMILALSINLLLIRIKSFDLLHVLTDIAVLPIFVVMNAFIFLSVCALVPILINALVALIYRPTQPLAKAIQEYGPPQVVGMSQNGFMQRVSRLLNFREPRAVANRPPKPGFQFSNNQAPLNGNVYNWSSDPLEKQRPENILPVTSTCETNLLVKQEFSGICDIIQAFDFYLKNEQLRLIVILDARDTTCPVQLAGIFYQVHSLLLAQPNSPIAFVIATDIKVSCKIELLKSIRYGLITKISISGTLK